MSGARFEKGELRLAPVRLPASAPNRRGSAPGSAALAGALIVVALNMRIAIAAVSPVLGQIRSSTGLSAILAGALTAAPIVCFGAFALSATGLIRRLDMDRLLWLTLATLAGGVALRLEPSIPALFGGTVVIGAATAVANVILPGLIKRDFAARAGSMTALYSVSLFASAALSAGLTVPLQSALQVAWRPAIALWGIPTVMALVVWGPLASKPRTPRGDREVRPAIRGLWSDGVAWAVTGFMGLQSLGYYTIMSWLPTILEDHHMSAATAGWMFSFSSFPAMAAALGVPILARRVRHHVRLPIFAVGCCAAGYVGLMIAPVPLAYPSLTLLGIGQGFTFTLALSYIVARAPDSHHAAHLSMMAQGVGYLIAAAGPFALGALHDLTSGWTVPLAALLGILVPLLASGISASRRRYVLAGGRPVPALSGTLGKPDRNHPDGASDRIGKARCWSSGDGDAGI